MKIAICDDEPKDVQILLDHCKACDLPYETVIFSTAADLLRAFSSDFYDLVFLDIEMAHPNGYEAGVMLSGQEPRPLIVFTTKSRQYAVQGYGIAFRYLCKPIALPAFRKTVEDALPYLIPKKVTLSYGATQKQVAINDILYIESQSHHLIFHLTGQQTFEVKDTIDHMLQTLSHPGIVRTHRSFCVNLDHIDTVTPMKITMTDGTQIPLARNRQEELRQQFTSLIRGGGRRRLEL